MDAKRALEVFNQIELWPGMPYVEQPMPTDFDEVVSFIRAALKAQGEPVYQYRNKFQQNEAYTAWTDWKDCDKATFDSASGRKNYETRVLYTAPQPESQPAQAVPDGELWSFVRSVMCQGANINGDYYVGKFDSYEEYSARLDAAASERAEELISRLAAPAPGGDV